MLVNIEEKFIAKMKTCIGILSLTSKENQKNDATQMAKEK